MNLLPRKENQVEDLAEEGEEIAQKQGVLMGRSSDDGKQNYIKQKVCSVHGTLE